MLLYHQLSNWYRLVDPTADHEDEAACYVDALTSVLPSTAETLLELGAGGGNNAFYMKGRFRCTLADVSPEMQAMSRELNPDCEHVPGDMRTLRLGRTFDAVMIHDAVMYMTSEAALRAAIATAFEHTRAGGAALFAPDFVRERFDEHANLMKADAGTRSLRGIEWAWDPDPTDDTFRVEYSLILRDANNIEHVHDSHVEGLFSRQTWLRLLEEAGYSPELIQRPMDPGGTDEIFLCRKP